MAHGSSRYDPELTEARKAAEARLAVLIIIDGNRGSGFAVQSSDSLVLSKLPAILRSMADEVDTDLEGMVP